MSTTERKAIEEHSCSLCGRIIRIGEMYRLSNQKRICWRHLDDPLYRKGISKTELAKWEIERQNERQKWDRVQIRDFSIFESRLSEDEERKSMIKEEMKNIKYSLFFSLGILIAISILLTIFFTFLIVIFLIIDVSACVCGYIWWLRKKREIMKFLFKY
ncbi:MAG: hypothetical protein ACTSRW_04135 [Candidatus Helarchaeota archaeon]